MRVAGVDSRSQPADAYISSSSASPGASGALSRQPYDSCDESERADHELWLFFVNGFDIAFRARDQSPRDGAHFAAAVQPLFLSGMALLRLSLWRLLRASRAVQNPWGSLSPCGGSTGPGTPCERRGSLFAIEGS